MWSNVASNRDLSSMQTVMMPMDHQGHRSVSQIVHGLHTRDNVKLLFATYRNVHPTFRLLQRGTAREATPAKKAHKLYLKLLHTCTLRIHGSTWVPVVRMVPVILQVDCHARYTARGGLANSALI
jgi:hypothetical protein